MKRVRNDFTIRKNQQTQRTQKDLWDVIAGGSVVTITHSEEKAQTIADALNKDPYAFDKMGQVDKSSKNMYQ